MRRDEVVMWGKSDIGDVVRFFDDFTMQTVSATVDLLPWFATVNSGTATIADDGKNGLLAITTHTDDNDQVGVQANGEMFKLEMGKPLRFSAKNLRATDVSTAGIFIGLAITDTSLLGNDTANAFTDGVGFLWDGSALYAVSVKNASTDWGDYKFDTGSVLEDATNLTDLAFTWDGAGKIVWYVNGTQVASLTDVAATKTKYPDDEALTPSIAAQALTGAAQYVYLDAISVSQRR